MVDLENGRKATSEVGKEGGQTKTTATNGGGRGPTWAEVIKGTPKRQAWTTHKISDQELGSIQTRFPDVLEVEEEMLEESRGFWKDLAVLVRSLGRQVPADWVVKEVRRALKLDYNPECFTMMDGYMTLCLACEVHREAAVKFGPWMVAGQVHAMERWRPNFVPGRDDIGRGVVWLRLPRLPLEFWRTPIILQLAAKAGKPLEVDSFTDQRKKMGFARVKIELDLKEPLRPGLFVKGRKD
ncbi:uncharacterized protein LOC120111717 [Phoenix dactylifera]|uniref:Uncharacterized protein LOC120111717 n=1 Tax=Phoenix dactylifera TaxID=42345 RepID=A0A8B9ANB9_PHODC|nr:uncharacterized protein LOC120111717 [Phoenix dactylifera]